MTSSNEFVELVFERLFMKVCYGSQPLMSFATEHRPLMLHPLNAALRFGLELLSIVMFARFGYSLSSDAARYAWMLALPLIAATLWATFTVAGDPSRGKDGLVPVSGAARLALEATFFVAAAAACYALTSTLSTGLFIGTVTLHYVWAHKRNRWLLTQRT